jgi:acyl dehydratase
VLQRDAAGSRYHLVVPALRVCSAAWAVLEAFFRQRLLEGLLIPSSGSKLSMADGRDCTDYSMPGGEHGLERGPTTPVRPGDRVRAGQAEQVEGDEVSGRLVSRPLVRGLRRR